jgi:multiple sugar transport system permease protein
LAWCEDQGTLVGCRVSSRVGQLDIQQYFFYSVLILVRIVAGIIFCWLVSYALAKMEIPWQEAAHRAGYDHADDAGHDQADSPSTVTFVSLFVLVSKMGLVNTYPALVLRW